MEKNKKIIDKISDISDEVSELEKARMNRNKLVSSDIVDFVRSQMEKAANEDDLESDVIREIKVRIKDDADKGTADKEITFSALVNSLDILSKNKNNISLGIFDIVKAHQKSLEASENNKSTDSNKELGDISKEDVQAVKEGIEFLKKVKKQEF